MLTLSKNITFIKGGKKMQQNEKKQKLELELKAYLTIKCLQDEKFKQEFLKNPKATFEREFKCKLPANAQVNVVQETENSKWFVLPQVNQTEELSEEDLKTIAGGGPIADEIIAAAHQKGGFEGFCMGALGEVAKLFGG
jgi:hypothetical protein